MSKTYLITGGTAGIGRAVVEKILSESKDDDDCVIVNYGHNKEKAEKFVAELGKTNRKKIILIKADMSDYDEMTNFVKQVSKLVDSIDYLICNTGIGTYMKFSEYTFDVWNNVMNTNLSIPVFMIRDLIPLFAENTSVVLMGSYAGRRPYSSSVVYSISKAGLIFLSQVLMKELEPVGARINAVAPGFIETDWQKGRSDESYERINKKIALHRFGTPQEVADLCCSIMKNTYVNGAVVDIHGGYDYF